MKSVLVPRRQPSGFPVMKSLILAFLVLPAAIVLGLNAEGFLVLAAIQSLPQDKSDWTVQHGTVVDAATHRPIVGAVVASESGVPLQFVLDRDKCRTDAHGGYTIRTKPTRDSYIFVRANGYRSRGFWNTLDEPVRMVRYIP